MTTRTATTRRERQREATLAEIVAVSRRLLPVAEDGLSVRAVATEMGMTAPALYRYVDGHPGLLTLVGGSILQDVGMALVGARDEYGDDDPGAQLVAMATAFRSWAVHHREEFALVFANVARQEPVDGKPIPEQGFADIFGEVYLRVWQRYGFPIVAEADFAPETLAALESGRVMCTVPYAFPGQPIGLVWHFLRAWMRLYGVVTLEVFKHMDESIITSGMSFLSVLEDLGAELAFGDDLPRLRALAVSRLA